MLRKIAALDLGSNSFHLAVAQCGPSREFTVRTRCKEKVQLGRTAFESGRLDEAAFERGVEALRRLRRVIELEQPELALGVATSALREAANGAEFVRQAALVLGFPVRIISGEEEARLVALGTLQALPARPGRLAIFDLGGGSTEVIVADAQGALLSTSLRLGTLRLRSDWRCMEPPSQGDLAWLERRAESVLEPTLARVARSSFEAVVLSCGSARDLARLGDRLGLGRSTTRAQTVLTRACVSRLQAHLAALAAPERAALIAGDPGRADTLLVAATVFKAIFAGLASEQAIVCKAGLREGVIADHLRLREQAQPLAIAL